MKKSFNKKCIGILLIIIVIFCLIFVIANNAKQKTIEVQENNQNLDNNSISIANETNEIKESVDDNLREKLINDRGILEKGLPVCMYHFFYDDVNYTKRDNNWLKISDFEEQLKYLTENEYYFPSWDEVNDYMDGNIKLPKKSVVLTMDDGDPSFFDLAVPLLQKYNVNATSFVVGNWYGYRYDENMKNVDFESHSYDMHRAGANGKGRMVNLSYTDIVQDLKDSKETMGGDRCKIFCYPFGHNNDTAVKALKDTGFTMAFTVSGGKIKPGMDKYKLPRVRVSDGNSLKYFISSIS